MTIILKIYWIIFKNQLKKLREDFRKINKEKASVEFEISPQDALELEKGKKFYINLNIDSSQIKQTASTLREKFPNATIVLASVNENQTLLAIASKTKDSNQLFKLIGKNLNAKGGGSAILAMGKIDSTSELEQIILEAISA